MLWWAVVIILLMFVFGGAPNLGLYHHGYGWGPSGLLGVMVLFLIIYLLTRGRL